MLAAATLREDALLDANWSDTARATSEHRQALRQLRQFARVIFLNESHKGRLLEYIEALPQSAKTLWKAALGDFVAEGAPLATGDEESLLELYLALAEVVGVSREALEEFAPGCVEGRSRDAATGHELVRFD